MDQSKHLMANIEKLRKKMITVGIKNGLESPQVIFLSQELDLLIFEFQNQLNSQEYNLQKSVLS